MVEHLSSRQKVGGSNPTPPLQEARWRYKVGR